MEQGYTLNEIIYACINKRAEAVSEAPLMVYNTTGEQDEEQPDHALLDLIHKPNERIDEGVFWQISQTYADCAGFALWEKELNNLGEPIRLWPMRPDWCSFYRGAGRILRAVRYQPYSLPPIDVPIDNVVLFGYFDPRYPGLRFLGPTQVALRVMGVDSELTDFVRLFFQQGASTNGILKTEQVLSDEAARNITDRWMQQHGGVGGWIKPAVLGQGVSYQSTAQTFKDFQFDQVDARNEARICTVFDIPPILLGTKVGLQSATYSNYEEARKAWYQHWVSSQWKWLAGQVKMQLLPDFDGEDSKLKVQFKLDDVKALQEDRNAIFTRSTEAAKLNVITRDEAREEMDFDPIDNEPVFVGATIRETLTQGTGIIGPEDVTGQNTAATSQPVDTGNVNPNTGAPVAKPVTPAIKPAAKPGTPAEQALEKKQFRDFAHKHTPEEIAGFDWRYTPEDKAAEMLREALGDDAPFQEAEDAAWAAYGKIQSGA
jgi:HK97 family phage portal protein